MSLLTLIQRAARAMSLTVPSAVVTSTDPQVLQLWELANEEGESLARDFDWQALRKEQVVAASATPDQPGWLPADFDRFVAETGFDRSSRRPLSGPISPRQWQAMQAQPAT
ncbi:MAG: hypothetical protein JWM33_3527, partial [Caulobacteraceae bacterium]|nr:hypothetical protein [Caulobacteraceae bacterium]